MGQVIELLKSINYQLPKEILFNYKKINITDSEFIIIFYLINQSSNIYNPKQIGNDLKLDLNNVLELINSLCEKGIIKIEMQKINNMRSEVINLDSLYEKIAFSLNEVEEKNNSNNIYTVFETEFGRTLSPMEYEIINGWIDNGYSEEIIKLALKEATYNGVNNLRYIDKIIYEWGKIGIKTVADVEKNRMKRNNSNKDQTPEDVDMDVIEWNWFDDDE